MTRTANCGNTRRRQQKTRPVGCRGTTEKSRRGAAPGLASEKFPLVQAKASTPIAPHLTAFFEQRLPIERHASENTSNSRSEEHTSELQSHSDLVCRLL